MAQSNAFHPSIEGAQHGAKSLEQFLDYSKAAGALGVQPSNYMLADGKGGLRKPKDIKAVFESRGMKLDGISAHCPFWVHTSIWTGTKSGNPFIPADVAKLTPEKIEKWHESYLLKLMDLAVELGIKTIPMFWGVAFGWEMATGYPWGFWAGSGFDLLQEGQERFVKKTAKLRKHAAGLGLYLCHEIHPGTAASCADDFQMLVDICDGDATIAVNADPSHCWEGETWESRFLKVGSRIYAAHVKNFVIRSGFPLRAMQPSWPKRAMQFTDLASGDINLQRYTELLLQVGYRDRYCKLHGTTSAPLVVEAESAHKDLDFTSANGVGYVRDNLCWPAAGGSFEDGMGA
ncbi:MAG TPA: sugar phosphate isomerase/epimerase [Candidatus Limnocylindria bacterium]|nr:sugar phosphate isomerase/epimerase [Candidatus Limnocylindria bacterium]